MIHFIIICDGGSRNNQIAEKREGYGSYMAFPASKLIGKTIKRLEFGEGMTNNEAEYHALIAALTHVTESLEAMAVNLKKIQITVRTDSQLVIGHLTRNWRIKADNLRPLAIKAASMCQAFHHVEFELITGEEMKSILGH